MGGCETQLGNLMRGDMECTEQGAHISLVTVCAGTKIVVAE